MGGQCVESLAYHADRLVDTIYENDLVRGLSTINSFPPPDLSAFMTDAHLNTMSR